MSVKLDDATDVTYIVTDVSGRVIDMSTTTNISQEVRTMNVSNLAAGVYMITAKTAKGTTTKRFVKK